jgi:predicted metal-dependent HD superfamily phosphohydrolase
MKDAFNTATLLPRWQALWQRLGVEDAALQGAGRQLINRYTEGRFYHTEEHLQSVLAQLDWAKGALERSGELEGLSPAQRQKLFDTVEIAIWYHDAVYNPQENDNEARSRDLFLEDAKKFGLPEDVTRDAARLIDLTAHHKDAKTLMERLMTDCDLAVLGARPAVFNQYGAGVREEYAHVPPKVYKTERQKILEGFLDQPSVFKTAAFRQAFEAQAKRNLGAAINCLAATTPGRKRPEGSGPSSR